MKDEKQKIFLELKSILSAYVPPLVVTKNEEKNYEISGNKKIKIQKREVNGIFFASTVIRKNYVSFYFFPIYTHREKFPDTPDDLMKLLKGKSCFHIKKFEDSTFEEIKAILDKGLEIYKKEGWV